MKLLYKFASRSRPDKLLATLNNITTMARHDNYEIQVTADMDDSSMVAIKDRIEWFPNTFVTYGTSTCKVDAINRDLEFFTDWDILINMSDDMEFIQAGFDTVILKDYASTVGDIFMHYPDQAAGAALCTLSIMDRKYFDRFGYIYHPDYKSLFADNEAQEVAKLLGRYKYFKTRLFNHNHPAWGLAQKDALMIHTESFWTEDEETYKRRKAINFGI